MTQARPYKALAVFASLIGLFSSSAVGMAYASTSHTATCASAAELSDGWTIATPESVGFESSHLCAIGKAAANGRLRNLHGVVVVRHGQLVFEQYFTGPDRRWGSSLGDVTFRAETLHDMRSITKSIVSLLYGIAQAQDKVASVERPLLSFFPELADLRTDPARMKILVKHALTMTMGTEWKESLAWEDPNNDERQMEVVADRYRYILDRPLVAAPGERWNYNGGATAVIAKLVSRETDRPLLEFAKEQLFGPLGITEVEWITDQTGEPVAAWGLRLRPRDLAKIGQLVLQRGRWGEQQVVPEAWIDEATAPQAQPTDPLLRYGYQWWLAASNFGDAQTPWIAGFGRGGQRLFILPDLDLVVVVTAGNYRDPEQWRLPNAILNQFVLPALVGGQHD
jgi:CubicO group peptidase (beta-lactamase class C family)